MTVHDAIVLGLGIHGSAATYEMARRGLDVVAIEQFGPGHARGSSHGATRMIRRAYPSPVWNEFLAHAYRGWERWARDAGRGFFTRTGGLFAHQGESGMQGGRTRAVDSGEATGLLPSLAIPEGHHAVFDPDAGVLQAADALAWVQRRAVELGAEVRFDETVSSWELVDGIVVVHTDHGDLRARRLVIAAGAFVRTLLPELAHFFEVWRILTYSAPPGQAVAQSPALGVFSIDRPDGLLFGLPESADAGAKVGVDAGPVWDPASAVAPATSEEIAELTRLMRSYVPGIETAGGEATACLYTMTPDRRFVIGERPGQPQVLVAAACSGHGFKFGPAVGEAIADLVDDIERPDLEFLSPVRTLS